MDSPSAAILLIGNELLSGKVEDTNAQYAVRELRELGVDLRRILVVPDEVEDIAVSVRDLSTGYDHVITSGGVGPTHDDVTMAAVARAFGTQVVRNVELERRLRDYYGSALEEASLRMADIPAGTELLESDHRSWPVMVFRNVYILPGIPQIFRSKFDALKPRLRAAPFYLRAIYVNAEESAIAPLLDRAAAAWQGVQIGSYPRLEATDYRVKVTVESKNAAAVASAFEELVARLPAAQVVRTE